MFSDSQGQDVTVSKFMRVWFKLTMNKARRSLLLPPVVNNTNNMNSGRCLPRHEHKVHQRNSIYDNKLANDQVFLKPYVALDALR